LEGIIVKGGKKQAQLRKERGKGAVLGMGKSGSNIMSHVVGGISAGLKHFPTRDDLFFQRGRGKEKGGMAVVDAVSLTL